MIELSSAWLALIGATFGGAGLKTIEYWLSRGKTKDDTAANLRQELRTELTDLRKELSSAEENLDKWRAKYYDLLDRYYQLKRKFIDLGGSIEQAEGGPNGPAEKQ